MKLRFIFTALMLIATTCMAQAQFKGRGASGQTMTVKGVIENAAKLDRHDTMVRMEGRIIEQINHDTYWFQDSTGKIRVEIDKDKLPKTPFDDKTKLIITGEVDYDRLKDTKVEAASVLIDSEIRQGK